MSEEKFLENFREEMNDQVELIKILIHSQHKVDELQKQSYELPMTQERANRIINEKIHDYVEKHPPDCCAAGRALCKISNYIEYRNRISKDLLDEQEDEDE